MDEDDWNYKQIRMQLGINCKMFSKYLFTKLCLDEHTARCMGHPVRPELPSNDFPVVVHPNILTLFFSGLYMWIVSFVTQCISPCINYNNILK